MNEEIFGTGIQYLKGVGEKRAALFSKLGIFTIGDLVSFYPRDYEDWGKTVRIADANPDFPCCIKARITDGVTEQRTKSGLKIYSATASDGQDVFRVVIFNNRFAAERLHFFEEYLFYGKITFTKGFAREMHSPDFFSCNEECPTGLFPVYRTTAGFTNAAIRRITASLFENVGGSISESLPQSILEKYDLCPLKSALHDVHYPKNNEELARSRRRLVFEEQLTLKLALSAIKNRSDIKTPKRLSQSFFSEFERLLPFEMTGAQKRACAEIEKDMSSGRLMCRLLQGDVGSGKTAVAAAAIYTSVKNGYQCALMAPTEILAVQHYEGLCKIFEKSGIKTLLLTGSMTQSKKKSVYSAVKNGEADLLIGTHALIQQDVEFKNLGLCITDEQHRFGVKQRTVLAGPTDDKAHMLVMSATPIPRSLALIIYGDLDISLLDELPPGRQLIDTFAVDTSFRPRVINFIKKQIANGFQAYLVCPLVEDGENVDLISATGYFEELRNGPFEGYNIGLLHGKMKPKEKERVMNEFVKGDICLLVATTVIEVGVNVPNAVLMVVENAERFGLSQLHQLRGRVGRGRAKSFCVLISDAKGENARRRMKVMKETNDGFKIADEDLRLRGPGDFFGSKQHGLPELKMSETLTDTALLKLSGKAADDILKTDPELCLPENIGIRQSVSGLTKKLGVYGLN